MGQSKKNLTAVFTDTANAIRAKKESVEEISPLDFADEIASIPSGEELTDGVYIVEGEQPRKIHNDTLYNDSGYIYKNNQLSDLTSTSSNQLVYLDEEVFSEHNIDEIYLNYGGAYRYEGDGHFETISESPSYVGFGEVCIGTGESNGYIPLGQYDPAMTTGTRLDSDQPFAIVYINGDGMTAACEGFNLDINKSTTITMNDVTFSITRTA